MGKRRMESGEDPHFVSQRWSSFSHPVDREETEQSRVANVVVLHGNPAKRPMPGPLFAGRGKPQRALDTNPEVTGPAIVDGGGDINKNAWGRPGDLQRVRARGTGEV